MSGSSTCAHLLPADEMDPAAMSESENRRDARPSVSRWPLHVRKTCRGNLVKMAPACKVLQLRAPASGR